MRARIEHGHFLAVLALMAVPAVSFASSPDANARWVAADPCLNLRRQPEVHGSIDQCLPRGVRVEVVGSVPGWKEVELADGTRGWLAERYLSREEPASSPASPSARPSSTLQASPVQTVPPMSDLEPAVTRPAFVALAPFEPVSGDGELVARKGVFRQRQLLTGELVPTRATPIVVPRTRAWSVQVRWLAEDGTEVQPGDPLVEFDNSGLASQLDDLRITAVAAAEELSRKRVSGDAEGAEKALEEERARIEFEKASLDASVPESLLSRREYQERQLALRRAQIALAKAREDLDAHQKTNRADVEIKRIALDKSLRQIDQLERDLEALTPKAPESGFVLVETHPWEGRKFAVGDTLWPGMTILTLPDLASLQVEARLTDVDDGDVVVGMPAICRLDAYPADAYACKITEIGPVAQPNSSKSLRRSFKVRLDLERTDPATMRPGMSVSVEVESQTLDDVLLAPRAGLDVTSTPARALLAGGGTADIELGPCNARECVVRGGIDEGRRLERRESEGP